jgi:hypothetical protein
MCLKVYKGFESFQNCKTTQSSLKRIAKDFLGYEILESYLINYLRLSHNAIGDNINLPKVLAWVRSIKNLKKALKTLHKVYIQGSLKITL